MMEIFDIYLLEAMVNGILLGGVLALLALGLNLIFGVIDVTWSCYAELVMIGMYGMYYLVQYYGLSYYLAAPLTILLLTPVIIRFYLPFFRRLEVASAYEYLERRFNFALRAYASLVFVCFQLGRVAIVTYLPSLALAVVCGLDVVACVQQAGIAVVVVRAAGARAIVIEASCTAMSGRTVPPSSARICA